ncbi:hypothetical protein BCU83_17855 [Vibrio breoganii]|nr:hypothetical protein BCU83_17855 [Vibrio breoganii]
MIITVRNTDVNLGFKVFFHYKWLLKIVLRYATTVVVVSPTYKDRIIEYFGIEFSNKIQIIPNGLETEFIANALLEKRATAICSGLFVGKIDSNKNLERSILAFSNAMKCIGRDDWSFRVVGGTEKEYNAIYMKLSAELREKVSFMGQVNDKNELISFYDISSLFIMPSFKETFGLVYLEAISRCVPVIYSKNQGIDGVFKEGEVGMRCEPHNLDSISESILQTLQLHPEGLGPFKSNPVSAFSWEEVAFRHYSKLYAPAFKCTKL